MKSFKLFLDIFLISFCGLAQVNLSVTDYQKDDKEFIFVCKTKDTKQTYNILFLFPYPDAVHFVVGNSKEHPKDNVRKKYSFSVKDAGNSIVLSGKSIRVKIGKKDMKVAINRPFESYFFQGFLQLTSHPEYDRRVIVLNHAIKPEERFFGFGERLSGFNQRGNRFVMELGDCWCESCTNAYKSIPFYYSSRSYALLINSHQRYIFDIGKPELRIT
jgi:alpha-glucosidase (family GH31 glycosyl hydrolase)